MARTCRVCRGAPVIDLRQHNAAFCEEHFLRFCRSQVTKTIEKHQMFGPTDRILVAVSGGKDSLALWDMLDELGYTTEGLTIGLGIDNYSDQSTEMTRRFAAERGLALQVVDLAATYGFSVPDAAGRTGRVPCSACGLSKRHVFDQVAREGGFDVVVTGHNLDDEAAVLFGNVMRWQDDYLGRQRPVLAEGDGFPRKAKPLVRLTERETAAWCLLRGIDYVLDECPMADGNNHLAYKELLNTLEERTPGAKQDFYLGFLRQGLRHFEQGSDTARTDLRACEECGAPTSADRCSFCRLRERASTTSVTVELGSTKHPTGATS